MDQLEWLIGRAIWLEAENNSKYLFMNEIRDSNRNFLHNH